MNNSVIQRIVDGGVVAIMRAKSSDQLLEAAEAVREGGVTAIEVTMTTPGALQRDQRIARILPG